jgi:glucosamine-6-phosphate deaminase
MPRPLSKVAPQWWDYTTPDEDLLKDAAQLSINDMMQLSGDGFTVTMHDTIQAEL